MGFWDVFLAAAKSWTNVRVAPEPDDAAFVLRGPALLRGQQDRFSVSGDALGPWMSFRYKHHEMSLRPAPWTEIFVDLPERYPLLLMARLREHNDREKIMDSVLAQLSFGDAEFDRAFLVEGAPIDVVKLLFDAPTRELLHALQCRLRTPIEGRPQLLMIVPGWLEGARARMVLESLAAFSSRVRDAYGEADAAAIGAREGFAFREEADGEAQRQAVAEREAQLAEVRTVWNRRGHKWWSYDGEPTTRAD